MNDPLGDLLTRIRNAQMRRRPKVSTPASNLRARVLDVLASEGYIRGYARIEVPAETSTAALLHDIGRLVADRFLPDDVAKFVKQSRRLSGRNRLQAEVGFSANNQTLQTVHEFRERLRVLWNGSNMSNESLLQHLKDWIAQAEASRIKVLEDFAASLRGYALRTA